jgi:hypothetical protein
MKTVVGAIWMIAAAVSAAAQTAAVEPAIVVVSGTGVVTAAPDQAWVRIGAETRAKAPREAQAANAAAMTAVQQKLAALGLAKDAVRTMAYDVQMEFDYANGRQTPRGYVARNTIEVRVDDLAKVGEVLDASVGSGATTVSGLRFDLKSREAAERDALQRAVADALRRAEAAAAGAKRVVDRVIRIEEAGARQGPPMPMPVARAMSVEAATPVVAGEIEIRADVTVTVTLK